MTEWAETNQLVIANTWFPNHKRKLYTWISPGDRVRNQIDFICVKRRFRNAIRSCRAYPGADCDSDHVPVVAICEAKLKNVKKARTKNVYDYDYNKMDTESLQVVMKEMQEVNNQIRRENPEVQWNRWKESCSKLIEDHVPTRKRTKSKPWVTPEFLDMMEKRRRYKQNAKKYHELNRIVKLMCIEAKENLLHTKCEKIEQTLNCTPKECQRLIREVTGKGRAKHEAAILKDEMGKTLYEQKDKLSRWKRYVASL